MKKIINISWKDLLLLYRDRTALIFMLAAPFVLTVILGAITGAFSSGQSFIQDIPILLVNQDSGPLGQVLVEAFDSPGLAGLFAVAASSDSEAARQQVEADQAAALIIIPAGFSASILPDPQTGEIGAPALVQIYTSPERPNSASILQSVVSEIVRGIESGPVTSRVTLSALAGSGRLTGDQGAGAVYAQGLGQRIEAQGSSETAIKVRLAQNPDQEASQPNPLAYIAPGMAIFFLMYTVSQGGRSILAEREFGTLARMLASPTNSAQILSGKVASIFVSGFLQVSLLILASALLFSLRWGAPAAVIALVVAVCLAATGWGILLASFATTSWQVSGIGSAMMLLFGLLGGTFLPVSIMSPMVQMLARFTPNYWAIQGFNELASGGGLADILPMIAALLLMALVLFIVSTLAARKRWASGFARM
jgi:ABC-2 type transport system permease protein